VHTILGTLLLVTDDAEAGWFWADVLGRLGAILLLREWESTDAMEAAYERFAADREAQELSAQGILHSSRWELYQPFD
jgi:hypothetical protein